MDAQTAYQLSQLTRVFYAQVSSSFSETRNAAWEGWGRVLKMLPTAEHKGLRVLDIACGNLRFERFLADEHVAFEAWCVDDCPELMELGLERLTGVECHVQRLDVGECLLREGGLAAALDAPACDVVAVFGFMHHVPLLEQRCNLVKACMQQLRTGGIAVFSFWQFARNEKLRAKAERSTAAACDQLGMTGLGVCDYLLGWQQTSGLYRYCHHFEEQEIDGLVSVADAEEIARFSADGKTHDLNRYVILRT